MTTNSSAQSPTADARSPGSSFLGKFLVLRGAVRELWIVFAVKLLGIVAYSVMNTTFVLWLSYDLGYSDARAGFLVATWSTVMTLITVFVGSLTDAIGLRKAFLLGVWVCVISRAVMTFTTVPWLALAGGLLPLAVGEALGVPVMVAGVRRYSTTAQRSISFAIFYAVMNVGFLIASFLFDYVRTHLGEPHGHLTLPLIGTGRTVELTTYRVLFLVSLLFEAAVLPILHFGLRDGVEATDEGVRITQDQPKYPGAALLRALALMARDALKETVRIFAGLWRQPGFYKFLAFLTLAAFVRLIFIHMYYTYPKFGIRELGEGAPVGRLFGINSVLIIILVPIVGALSQRVSAYKMVTVGSCIAAGSVFIMAAPPRWFAPLADGLFGHAVANRWLGGYDRFTPDDIRDLPALAARLHAPTSPLERSLAESLSPITRALLERERGSSSSPRTPEAHPGTALFATTDLRDVGSLIARLRDDREASTRPVSQYVWGEFSAAGQATLRGVSRPESEKGVALIDELNRLLHRETLYRTQYFGGVRLSEAAQAVGMKDPKQKAGALPNQSLLFNRLWLEEIYPEAFARSVHPLRVALATDLTRLLSDPGLRSRPGFSEVSLSSDTRARMQRLPTGVHDARLNRLLLEDALGADLAPNRVGTAGSVNPYYVMIFLFIVLLSVGESIYSPRLYEYAAVIAPKGQEASYMSLSYLPFFAAKLVVATFSGVLLAQYCPATGARHSEALWLIIALTTMIAPVGLLTLRRYIRVKEAGREE